MMTVENDIIYYVKGCYTFFVFYQYFSVNNFGYPSCFFCNVDEVFPVLELTLSFWQSLHFIHLLLTVINLMHVEGHDIL